MHGHRELTSEMEANETNLENKNETNLENKTEDHFNNTEITQIDLQESTVRSIPNFARINKVPKKCLAVSSSVFFFLGFGLGLFTAPTPEIHANFTTDIQTCNSQLETSTTENLKCITELASLSSNHLLCTEQISKCTTENHMLVLDLSEKVIGTLQDHSKNLTEVCKYASSSICAGDIDLSSCNK